MERSLEVLEEPLARRGARRRYSVREREDYIRKYESSGLKQRVYAQRAGVSYTTFLGWLRKHRREERALQGQVRFTELTVGGLPSSGREESVSGLLEVCLPGGVILRGQEALSLSQLYHGVRGRT